MDDIQGMNAVTLAKPAGAYRHPWEDTNDVTPINVHELSAPWTTKGPPLSPFMKWNSFFKRRMNFLSWSSYLAGGLVGLLGTDCRVNDNASVIDLGAIDV
jgi:hypothetical protein